MEYTVKYKYYIPVCYIIVFLSGGIISIIAFKYEQAFCKLTVLQ